MTPALRRAFSSAEPLPSQDPHGERCDSCGRTSWIGCDLEGEWVCMECYERAVHASLIPDWWAVLRLAGLVIAAWVLGARSARCVHRLGTLAALTCVIGKSRT